MEVGIIILNDSGTDLVGDLLGKLFRLAVKAG